MAVVIEVVDVVQDGPVGIEREHGERATAPVVDRLTDDKTTLGELTSVSIDGTVTRVTEKESPLRQRLRQALTKPSPSASSGP